MNVSSTRRLEDEAEPFDWHQDYESLRNLMTANGVTPGKKVLILGCGNCSEFQPCMHHATMIQQCSATVSCVLSLLRQRVAKY